MSNMNLGSSIIEKKKYPQLKWNEITIKEWYSNHIEKTLFIVKGSETPVHHGYFEGDEKLLYDNISNLECFYYYGKKCEKKNEDDEECECYLGKEFSSLTVEYFCSQYDEIVENCIKPMLEIEE